MIKVIICWGIVVYLNVFFGDDFLGFNISNFDVNNIFIVVKNYLYGRNGVYCINVIVRNFFFFVLVV